MKSNMDRVVLLKTHDPRITAREVAEKLGVTVPAATRYLSSNEVKDRLDGVRARVMDQIAQRHARLVLSAMDELATCLVASKTACTDLDIRLSACKFILGPIFDQLGRDTQQSEDIEFEVKIHDDGAIECRQMALPA